MLFFDTIQCYKGGLQWLLIDVPVYPCMQVDVFCVYSDDQTPCDFIILVHVWLKGHIGHKF